MLGGRLKKGLGKHRSAADMRERSAIAFPGKHEPYLVAIILSGEDKDFGLGAEGGVKGAEHVFVLGCDSGLDGGAAVGEDRGSPGVGCGFCEGERKNPVAREEASHVLSIRRICRPPFTTGGQDCWSPLRGAIFKARGGVVV